MQPGDRIYAIGDIHGRSDLLDKLYAQIRADAGRALPGHRLVVHLGDYVDRGPDSRGVIDRVIDPPLPGFESVALIGNHDWMMRDFLERPVELGPGWMMNGAGATFASYGVDPPRFGEGPAGLTRASDALKRALPPSHAAFLGELRPMAAAPGYLFVHAGIRPGVAQEDQQFEDLIWIREEFLHSAADHGAIVVHGHTIVDAPELRPNRIGIDTGAYRSGHLTAVVLSHGRPQFLQT